MFKVRSLSLKLMIVTGLLLAVCLVMTLSGVGLIATILAVSGLAVFLWYFTRRPPPKEELPCAAVSCCHYLEDDEED
ncbi:MAG: hypothetical protein GQ542_10975 [Desulforhopalus sp.]|nr:hypothetical protein [Desulforhopalus sp.]